MLPRLQYAFIMKVAFFFFFYYEEAFIATNKLPSRQIDDIVCRLFGR